MSVVGTLAVKKPLDAHVVAILFPRKRQETIFIQEKEKGWSANSTPEDERKPSDVIAAYSGQVSCSLLVCFCGYQPGWMDELTVQVNSGGRILGGFAGVDPSFAAWVLLGPFTISIREQTTVVASSNIDMHGFWKAH